MHQNDFSRVAAHRRAAEYYHKFRLQSEDWQSPKDLEPMLSEFGHLLSAGDYDQACTLVNEIDDFYLSRWGQTEQLLSMRRSLLDRISDTQLAVMNLLGLARAHTRLGDSKQSVDYVRKALGISSTNQNLGREAGIALANLAGAHFDLGLFEEAVEYYNRSILIARENGDERGESSRLVGLAVVYRELAEFGQAIKSLENAIAVIAKIAPTARSVRGSSLKNLGDIYRLLAKYADANDCFREALDISREEVRKSPRAEHEALSGFGSIYEDSGDFHRAHDLVDQALQIAIKIHERDSEGFKRMDIGRLEVMLGSLGTGLESLSAAMRIADELSIPRLKHCAGLDLTWANLVSGQIEDAWHSMQRALEFTVPRNAPTARTLMGMVFTKQGQFSQARSEFEEATVLANSLLAKNESYYAALYAKALSLAGIYLLDSLDTKATHADELTSSIQSCLDHCNAPGVIKYAINLLDVLKPIDVHEVLSGPKTLLMSQI